MTERSMFWTTDGTGDGPSAKYAQARLQSWLAAAFLGDNTTQGPLKNYLNELEVTNPSGATLRVATGAAVVDGLFYENTANVDKTVTTPVVGTTGWRLVLRASWSAQTVRVTLLESTDGVATIPAVTQTEDTTWEISLAYGTITTGGTVTVYDGRSFCVFNGEVAGSVIRDGTITGDKISFKTITADELNFSSVTDDELADGAVTLSKIADNAVDDTKVGNRVPQFYRRQGSASSWDAAGTTTYTPTAVRMQGGSVEWTGSAATSGNVDITFPVSFGNNPLVLITSYDLNSGKTNVNAVTSNMSSSGVKIEWESIDGSTTYTGLDFHWLAVGPE